MDRAFDVCLAECATQRGRADHAERRAAEFDAVAEELSQRVVERERELREARQRLAEARRKRQEDVQSLVGLAGQIEDVRAQARGQATRIRMSALKQAVGLSEQVAAVAKRPAEAGERVREAIEEVVAPGKAREGGEEGPEDSQGAGAAGELTVVGESQEGAGADPRWTPFAGVVHVDVGPFDDFSQLARFEDAANGIGATSDVSIRRFSGGRATLALNLREPVELLEELKRRSEVEFTVRKRGRGHLILDVA